MSVTHVVLLQFKAGVSPEEVKEVRIHGSGVDFSSSLITLLHFPDVRPLSSAENQLRPPDYQDPIHPIFEGRTGQLPRGTAGMNLPRYFLAAACCLVSLSADDEKGRADTWLCCRVCVD